MLILYIQHIKMISYGIIPQILLSIGPSVFLLGLCGISFFFKSHFLLHRLFGFLFLVQYTLAWIAYFVDYEWFSNSFFILSIPLNGCIQAITAIFTFTFLAKKQVNPGFFGDQGTMTYAFVKENLFYQLMTLLGFMYFNDNIYNFLRSNTFGQIVELIFVFLPYIVIRPFFPKTHFRDAIKQDKKTEENKVFYFYGLWAIRIFYVLAKHFMGHYLNYIRFFDKINADDRKIIIFMLLANAGTVSIAVFLSTLRLKGMLSPRVSYCIYVTLAYLPFLGFLGLTHLFFDNMSLTIFTLIGCVLNFLPKIIWSSYQILLCILFYNNIGYA